MAPAVVSRRCGAGYSKPVLVRRLHGGDSFGQLRTTRADLAPFLHARAERGEGEGEGDARSSTSSGRRRATDAQSRTSVSASRAPPRTFQTPVACVCYRPLRRVCPHATRPARCLLHSWSAKRSSVEDGLRWQPLDCCDVREVFDAVAGEADTLSTAAVDVRPCVRHARAGASPAHPRAAQRVLRTLGLMLPAKALKEALLIEQVYSPGMPSLSRPALPASRCAPELQIT